MLATEGEQATVDEIPTVAVTVPWCSHCAGMNGAGGGAQNGERGPVAVAQVLGLGQVLRTRSGRLRHGYYAQRVRMWYASVGSMQLAGSGGAWSGLASTLFE